MIRILQSISLLSFSFTRIFASAIFFGTLLLSNIVDAQVKFSVVSPSKIGKDDLIEVQFRVENGNDVQSINPPSFKGLRVISGPNQERSVTNINGRVSQYVAIGFSLQAPGPGKYTIGAATAMVDGTQYSTKPVTVEVTNASTMGSPNSQGSLSPFSNFNFDIAPAPVTHEFDDYILKPGENVSQKTQKNLFLKLDVTKTSCYVGEPIVAAYKLYTRLHSETTITSAPSFNGFSVSDLSVDNNARFEKYNGRDYNVYTLRKVELYPLQPGSFTLDPVVADNNVTFIKSEYANAQNMDDFLAMLQNYGDAYIPKSGLVEEKINLKTEPLTINVLPLPAKDKPADFKGAVGKFAISADLQKNEMTTDDVGNLIITIKGKGNIQLVNAPAVVWPQNTDGFDPRVKDDVDKTQFPMSGSKTFTFPFTISKPGNYKIDSITFSYFDPSTATYKELRTAPLQINVTKGTGVHPVIPQDSIAKAGQPEAHKISLKTELIAGGALLALIIFSIAYFLIRKNRNKEQLEKNVKVDDLKNEAGEAKEEFIIPKDPLLEAHDKLLAQDGREFFYTLNGSLRKYLSDKFHIPINEVTRKRLSEELDKCDVGLNTTLMLTSLFDEIEINLYAPSPGITHMNAAYEKAGEVISLLDKQVCS